LSRSPRAQQHAPDSHATGKALPEAFDTVGTERPKLRQLCLDKQLVGNELPDGWLAAGVDQHAEHLVGFDGDFKKLLPRARFTHLKG
jgi:hypothetical protein